MLILLFILCLLGIAIAFVVDWMIYLSQEKKAKEEHEKRKEEYEKRHEGCKYYCSYSKQTHYYCDFVFMLNVVFGIIGVIMLVAIIFLTFSVAKYSKVDEKINLYTEQNEEIEDHLYTIVKDYMTYEEKTYKEFKKEDSITYVSLYPELKANTLVEKQIDTYTTNKRKLNEFREQKIDQSTRKWWLYFGN